MAAVAVLHPHDHGVGVQLHGQQAPAEVREGLVDDNLQRMGQRDRGRYSPSPRGTRRRRAEILPGPRTQLTASEQSLGLCSFKVDAVVGDLSARQTTKARDAGSGRVQRACILAVARTPRLQNEQGAIPGNTGTKIEGRARAAAGMQARKEGERVGEQTRRGRGRERGRNTQKGEGESESERGREGGREGGRGRVRQERVQCSRAKNALGRATRPVTFELACTCLTMSHSRAASSS